MSLVAHVEVRARDVSARIEVTSGDSLVLVGPNGSGKSTVVEAVAGVVPLDAGEIEVEGRPCRAHGRERSARVALVPQDGALLPHLSVLDNVAFGPRARGVRRENARAKASDVLERLGAAHLTMRRPHELSGGEMRRAAIARALALEPHVILLDEPFAGLDVDVTAGIRALVASLRSTTTMVLTTHDAADAVLLGDQVAVLEEGRVVESGTPGDVFTHPRTPFSARMAGRLLVTGAMTSGGLMPADGEPIPVSGDLGIGQQGAIAPRPAEVRVQAVQEPRDASCSWRVQPVTGIEPRTDTVRYYGGQLAADVDPERAQALMSESALAFGIPHGVRAYRL